MGYGLIRSTAKLLSKDEARRIAVNFAKLLGLLPKAFSDVEPTYATGSSFSTAAFATRPHYAHIFKLMDRGEGITLSNVSSFLIAPEASGDWS